jgi:hypothetical protein
LAGTIPLAEPEHDTPWPVATLVSDALLAGEWDGRLAGELLAEELPVELLAGDGVSAMLLASVVFACRAW